jgi:CBS domain containing-hemolysin-like protein
MQRSVLPAKLWPHAAIMDGGASIAFEPPADPWIALAYAIAGLVLLSCNFFFVMSEFAFVKVRDSQVAALALANDPRAPLLRHIRGHLDEYLSVVQVGITGATIGMGVVIDEGFGQLVKGLFARIGWSGEAAGIVSVVVAFALATYLTIVTSELVPKAIAIRNTERAALIAARPMRILYSVFFPFIFILNRSARGLLRLLGFGKDLKEIHTEDELRIILGESQDGGVMPFRRLLLFENLFDMGSETVKDAMRPRSQVKSMPADGTSATMIEAVVSHGYSRYPVVARDADPAVPPLGIVHAKEVLAKLAPGAPLSAMARPFLTFPADAPLERALGEFQRSRNHLAVVIDATGRWVGLLSFEDVIEEIVGSIEDEFEREQPLHLDELLTDRRVALDIAAASIDEAIGLVMRLIPLPELPGVAGNVEAARLLLERERSLSTYVGRGIAIPHARIEGLERPIAIFARLTPGIPVANRRDTARFLFILLVPAGAQRLHLRLLARIAQIAESDYILERLGQADDAAAIQEALMAGDRATTG